MNLSGTHFFVALSSGSGLALGLSATGVVPAVIILLFLLCATAEHGEDGRGGDGLVLRRLGLLDLRVGVLGSRHLESAKEIAGLTCISVRVIFSRSVSKSGDGGGDRERKRERGREGDREIEREINREKRERSVSSES